MSRPSCVKRSRIVDLFNCFIGIILNDGLRLLLADQAYHEIGICLFIDTLVSIVTT